MFNWDDQELANIIWGEEGESEDHIVPYPDETSEKPRGPYGEHSKASDHEAENVKLTDKTSIYITDSQEESSAYNEKLSADGFGSLPDMSASNATNLDLQHLDEKVQEDNGSQIIDNQAEDRDGSNFVDYDWDNVGSFDDLDRILSNHDRALWSSTKDVTTCSVKSTGDFSINSQLLTGDIKNNCQQKEKSATDEMAIGKCAQMDERRKSPLRSQNTTGEQSEARRTQFINKIPSTPGYNMMGNQHSAGTGMPHQQVSSASSYLLDKTQGLPSMMPQSMTPQEKIEKLRRRQQMRALIAIRKQKQEFVRAVNIEIDENLSDSDTRPVMMDKSTLADTILHQLENVIPRLGNEIRICIRDSLFRLAQSALQRQCDDDTISTNRSTDDSTGVKEERSSTVTSSARMPKGETKTNPLDRAVAHLLFYTPPELSGELLQSTSSVKSPFQA